MAPPLHPLIVGIVLAVGGLDYRWAVLPSLAGWVGTALFGFLAARRAAGSDGTWAGLVAALFILGSPAHRAFATDIMLESLGACLTLLVLYLYLVVRQEPSVAAGRWFALALTALFFGKYNYWLLTWVPLAVVALVSHGRGWWPRLEETARNISWRHWAAAQFRYPLNYPLAILLVLLAAILLGDWRSVEIAGHRISLERPHNLIHLVYVVLFLQLWPWWRRGGRAWVGRLAPVPRQVVYWHVWPVLLWFLWPQRLGYFLWYLGPRGEGAFPRHDLGGWTGGAAGWRWGWPA